jgi:hypothetical protein
MLKVALKCSDLRVSLRYKQFSEANRQVAATVFIAYQIYKGISIQKAINKVANCVSEFSFPHSGLMMQLT